MDWRPSLNRSRLLLFVILFGWALQADFVTAQQPSTGILSIEKAAIGYWHLASRTFGGNQLWTDIEFLDGWRIQEQSLSGKFRLVDANDVQQVLGNEQSCRDALQAAKEAHRLKAAQGRVVILLHGLIRSRDSMESLAEYLRDHGDWTVINLQYASTRESIEHHAAALRSVIERLGPDVTEIDFVAHSMGNLVVRRYLSDVANSSKDASGSPPIKRMVMLGPPNHGSRSARLLKSSWIFNAACGPSGFELSTNWKNQSN